ncbi:MULTISPECIES: helix-turn-helix transcriptional regulator [unclassified Saccharopolyspora]|uniref:helix-turn-helix domain-containing protein n=1 Tax=Saccharopolyspora TaxID=1835 RepID=UPI0025E9ACB4|nr:MULTISPECIES: helix-turn-helix transcriptional regulator [unclassified Saccharopolyspora]
MRSDPASTRRRIGAALRQFRNEAGKTAEQAAEELGCSRGKVSQMEAGMYRLQHRDVRDLLRFYRVPETEVENLVAQAKSSAEPSWWEPYADIVEDWFAFFLGSEGEAAREFNYEQLVIPGLLQTRDYAEALTEASRSVAAQDRRAVAELRLERQRRLHDSAPLRLDAVIEESALRRPVGGVEILRGQLAHLVKVATLPHVRIQVLPTSAGAHSGMDGKFIVLEFASFSPGVFLEGHPVLGARYDVGDPLLAETYLAVAKSLRNEALSEEDSREFIEAVLTELP